MLGIMRKLKCRFSRQTLSQIYVSYIRPLLHVYGSAVRSKTKLLRKTSQWSRSHSYGPYPIYLYRKYLYKECGWDSLAKRRYFQIMCFMYKCSNNLVPDYISNIIPSRVGEITNYPLRNRQNLTNMYTRTEYLANLVSHHLYLTGKVLIMILDRMTLTYLFVTYLKTNFYAMPTFPLTL